MKYIHKTLHKWNPIWLTPAVNTQRRKRVRKVHKVWLQLDKERSSLQTGQIIWQVSFLANLFFLFKILQKRFHCANSKPSFKSLKMLLTSELKHDKENRLLTFPLCDQNCCVQPKSFFVFYLFFKIWYFNFWRKNKDSARIFETLLPWNFFDGPSPIVDKT